ncbi:hypothetical protein M0812_25101 [Anaeramoeba flamelloides]|uniref:Uncharacterized protein n=1 Tax=Anaeramoeba flamelloides TaxID=1746091 RepID=A0AAV7YLJ9_9EUKA|nr:hypothetical protein M0812_25101 [Anaeramoeba flamelloides]
MQAVKRCLSMFKKRLPKSLQGMDSWNFNFNTRQPDLLYACWRELLFREKKALQLAIRIKQTLTLTDENELYEWEIN